MHPAVPLLQDFLDGTAQRLPAKTAILTNDGEITYRELQIAAERLAAFLHGIGVRRGDRVLVFMQNSLQAAIAFWGILRGDAVVSIISPSTKTDKLRYLARDTGAVVLLTEEPLRDIVMTAIADAPDLTSLVIYGGSDVSLLNGQLPESCHGKVRLYSFDEALRCHDFLPEAGNIESDLASIIYTSGSTGQPKGVVLTHRNMIAAATSVSSYLGLGESDVILNVLPMAFDYGLYQLIMSVKVGATLVLERSFAYPGGVIGRMVSTGVTVLPGIPTIFSALSGMLHLKGFDFTRVRLVTNTAAALSESHIDFIRTTFPNARLYSMYGLTECKRCTYLPPEDLAKKKLSVGIAIPNTELWLVDSENRRLGPGATGELVIRGPTVMKGYWRKPDETAEKLRPGPLPGEQVLYTGDICRMDEDGYLYFVARKDDMIKCRGEKVAPREVENVLYALKGVRDAAVIGVPDTLFGQVVKAFVVPREGVILDRMTIMAQCAGRLENFMVPKYIEIVEDLPRTASGKIDKRGLS